MKMDVLLHLLQLFVVVVHLVCLTPAFLLLLQGLFDAGQRLFDRVKNILRHILN
jgi:hypothetical protein